MTKAELSNSRQVDEWLRAIGLSPVPKTDTPVNWAFEVTYPVSGPIRLAIANPKSSPRAVTVACRILSSPEHVDAFNGLDENAKREFWQRLRSILNREYIEFQIEGMPFRDCPVAFFVTSVRYDDGLTLDSFARTLNSVNKACLDGCELFYDRLGGVGPAASGGDFEFKRVRAQQ